MTTTDGNGIVFLEETDSISPFHTLINGLQQGTSDAIGSLKSDLDNVTQDTGWIDLTLTNGWTESSSNFTPQYRMRNGIVALRGRVTGGTPSASIAALPAAIQPDRNTDFVVREGGSNNSVVLIVGSTGSLTASSTATSPNLNVVYMTG